VADVVAGLLLLGASGADGVWNISSGEATTIIELAGVIDELLGRTSERVFVPSRKGDIHSSIIANARLAALGWSPRYGLRDGLRDLLGV